MAREIKKVGESEPTSVVTAEVTMMARVIREIVMFDGHVRELPIDIREGAKSIGLPKRRGLRREKSL